MLGNDGCRISPCDRLGTVSVQRLATTTISTASASWRSAARTEARQRAMVRCSLWAGMITEMPSFTIVSLKPNPGAWPKIAQLRFR
jgi:hypothetical protein